MSKKISWGRTKRTLDDLTPEDWDEMNRNSIDEGFVSGQADPWDSLDGQTHYEYEEEEGYPGSLKRVKKNYSEGIKLDTGKARMDLITPEMLNGLADPLTYGASKYADNNWRKGLEYSRVVGAAMRHLTLWLDGVNIDEESGLKHIDQAFLNLGFLVTFEREGRTELDDLYGRNK